MRAFKFGGLVLVVFLLVAQAFRIDKSIHRSKPMLIRPRRSRRWWGDSKQLGI